MEQSIEKEQSFFAGLLPAFLLSTSLWLILRTGGFFLSLTNPERYHPATDEALQGLVLAVILGCILGSLWEIQQRTDH